jgi:hypothetical protein
MKRFVAWYQRWRRNVEIARREAVRTRFIKAWEAYHQESRNEEICREIHDL